MAAPVSHVWLGWARDASGFSDELRGFLRASEAAGLRPSVVTLDRGVPTELTPADRAMLDRQEHRSVEGRVVAIHSYVPGLRQPIVDGQVNVARSMFETDRVPEHRLPMLLDRDEIWVPNAFNAETFARGGVPPERLHVLGGTLDFDLFDPAAVEPAPIPAPDGHFTFLTNFAFSERKAWRHLLRAWAQAFGPDDGVCLVLKVHTEGRDVDVRERIDAFLRRELGPAGLARMAPIRVMSDVLPATEMPRLYAAADAYVMPSRGEGWGRPYMEAMAMGLPTIGSRWSGNLAFMDDANSWLVDGEVVPVGEHAEAVFSRPLPGHRWFEPDVDALVAQLRAVAGDPAAARAKAAGARAGLLERFGPEIIAARIAQLARDAADRHAERAARPYTCAVRGAFGSISSLAVVNDAIAEGLEARGHHVRRTSQGAPPAPGPQPTIFHHWPPDFASVPEGPAIHMLPWEYGAPPAAWIDGVAAGADRVWVYSDYIRRGYVEAGMPPGAIDVVPLGLDVRHFTPEGPRRREAGASTCTFLFVGGTIWRKGVDLLVRAWREAFGPADDVQLVIKDFGTQTHYRNQSVIDAAALARDPRIAPVVHLTEEIPYTELPALYRGADVVVLPYRAEGFCLPALEAMACGVPVIHNGAGPTGEFVPADGGWALGAARRPLPESAQRELGCEGWVNEVSHDELVAALREAAADAAGRAARGARALAAAQGYTRERTVERAEGLLAELAAEALPPVRTVRPAVIEAAGETVLFAPDWSAGDWRETVAAWLAAVGPADPVTLQLFAGDADVEALAPEIEAVMAACGRAEDELPDLALCLPSDHPLEALVLGAHAVLAGAGGAAALPPFARRRARRVLEGPAGIAAYVAQLPAREPAPVAQAA